MTHAKASDIFSYTYNHDGKMMSPLDHRVLAVKAFSPSILFDVKFEYV